MIFSKYFKLDDASLYLVGTASRQIGWLPKIHSAVGLRNVSPDRETRLKEQPWGPGIGDFDAVDLNADVPRRLQNIYSLHSHVEYHSVFAFKSVEERTL